MSAPLDLLLPTGVRLIHIGPHKTGTTAIQGAFHLAREQLADHGVVFAGTGRHPMRAVLAVTGRRQMLGEPRPDISNWNRLVEQVDAAGDCRSFVSSEFFADGDDAAAQRVVESLGGPRAHIVVTLRPLAKILPSQWQQYVQNGLRTSYAEWLDGMFNKPPYTKPTATFWQRHRHDNLVERWVAAAGSRNVTAVVVDEADPSATLRAFESMLGLPSEFLVPEEGPANRSLTFGEVELVRLLNNEFKSRAWPDAVYAKFLRYGAVAQTRAAHRPSAAERIPTPMWALERAADVGAQAAERIAALGVRVVGDLSSLGRLPAAAADAATMPVLPATAAAQAVLGVILASGAVDPELSTQDRPVREASSADLVRTLVERTRRRAVKTIRRTRRRVHPPQ